MFEAVLNSKRNQRILGDIIRAYVETGEPVSSRAISMSHAEGLSPATIRNAMAELEEAEHGDLPAARLWLARATTTATQDAGYVCAACGGEVARWTSLCPHCRSFDSIEWRPPGRPPVPHLQAASQMMPALPVPGGEPAPRPPREGLGLAIDDSPARL